jgi:hypothetical protein
MDLILVPLQFLILTLICKDSDIKYVGVLLSLLFCLDIFQVPPDYHYQVHAIYDMATISIISILVCSIKRLILFSVCMVSLIMNLYEYSSVYQTMIYPYRDVIQWWMVEFMFIVLAWKCQYKWSK